MSREILVLNCGSSSVKYQLFAVDAVDQSGAVDAVDPSGAVDAVDPSGAVDAVDPSGTLDGLRHISGGLIERIGEPDGPASHEAALTTAAGTVRLDSPDLIAVGHRVVHGGARFTEPTLITDEVMATVARLTPLAPLHNPPNLAGIAVARALRPELPQVAVFDTAFHATMPEHAWRYAIDTALADEHGVRRYGFHGTSHEYVGRVTARLLGRPLPEVNTISLHLGNGASACAIQGGRSVDTSMGLTPLEGLVMGTRSGDLDPAVVFHLYRQAGLAVSEIDGMLNRRSGLRGLAGDNDMRDVLARRAAGDRAAALAFDMYCYRIRKYIGAYVAVLGRVDAVTFTAGVGEHAAPVRAEALRGLDRFGIAVSEERNSAPDGEARIISPDGSPVTVCVVPTDEEHEIALQTLDVVRSARVRRGRP
ncbi:MAG TPA: acetate kinase [Micromonosporaceae bacterium]